MTVIEVLLERLLVEQEAGWRFDREIKQMRREIADMRAKKSAARARAEDICAAIDKLKE